MKKLVYAGCTAFMLSACGSSSSSTSDESTGSTSQTTAQTSVTPSTTDTTTTEASTQSTSTPLTTETLTTDITDKIFTNKSENCSDFVAKYVSNVKDIQNDTDFAGALEIEVADGKCTFTSNVIPNHDFNDETAHFADVVEEQTSSLSVSTTPSMASTTTAIHMGDVAMFLNGVTLDVLSAGCFGIGDGNIGCHDIDQPFRSDPLGTESKFGADAHNAHTQPGGKYHYHGSPLAMYDISGSVASAVIGFAADGYPIFGTYFDDNGTIKAATSSYALKSGTRTAVTFNGTTYNPGGTFDGTYVDDWEYVSGKGNLDECNGMSIDGVYGYYTTTEFPYVINCYKGTPDSSFIR